MAISIGHVHITGQWAAYPLEQCKVCKMAYPPGATRTEIVTAQSDRAALQKRFEELAVAIADQFKELGLYCNQEDCPHPRCLCGRDCRELLEISTRLGMGKR